MEVNLLAHIQKGEKSALKEAFHAYFEILYRQAVQSGMGPELAEQAIAEAFQRLWSERSIGEAPSLLQWLQQQIDESQLHNSASEDQSNEQLSQVLQNLSDQEQKLLQLLIFEGKSIEAAANLVQLTSKNAALSLSDALQKLSEAMESTETSIS